MNRLSRIFLDHVGQTSDMPMGLEIDRAQGVMIHTTDGKEYIDLVSGVSVCNVGHSNQYVIDAICNQAKQYTHTMVYGEFVQSPQVEYAQLLTSQLPDQLDCVYFVNSGSEAIEGSLKLAKRYTNRTKIVSFKNAYHGSTHGALSVMGGEYFRNAFRPLLPDVYQIDFNASEQLDQICERTAAVIVEPFQGEGGFIKPQKGFLEALRKRCDEVGALLIFDEIQSGFGRTGSLFAFQKYGVTPDILAIAKAMGGGMPLGGFVSSKEILSVYKSNPVLGHITTFGGHPVCCAAAKASLEYILDNRLMEEVERKSQLFETLLCSIKQIKEIRREGLMIGLDLGDETTCSEFLAQCKQEGIITENFLFNAQTIRIAPPLTISDEEIELACQKIKRCFI